MKQSRRSPVWSLSLILIIALSLANIGAGHYDGETPTDPPPATQESTETPEETVDDTVQVSETPEVETEVPAEATPVPEDTLETPTDEAASDGVTEAVTEPTATPEETLEPPAPEENIDEEPSANSLLSELPDSTDVVILDENGEPVPLVTMKANDIVQAADPMWCPAGSQPNDSGCVSYATISDLITDMATNPGNFNQDAVIFFEKPAGGFTNSFILDEASLGTSSYDIIKNNNLTLTGGWAGGASTTISGQTDFTGAFLQIGSGINPWVGAVTISRFAMANVSTGNGLTVYTSSGDISVGNVAVTGQTGNFNTASLESDSGNITVDNGSFFDGNNSPGNQSKGFSAKTNTGTIDISDTTFRDSAGANNNGASLSAPVITLNNVIAQRNTGNGISISDADLVTLNNVIAAPDTAGLGNGLSGVLVTGTGSTIVDVVGGTFNQNTRYGVELTGSILNEQSPPTCANNALGTVANPCYNVTPNEAPTIVVNDTTLEGDTLGGWILAFGAIGNASDAEDGAPSVSCTPAIGTLLATGTTTNVTCTATDSGSLTASDSGMITVQDTTPPVIATHSDLLIEVSSAGSISVLYTLPTTSDAVDGAGVATCSPAPGSLFAIGSTTTVTCNATDSRGNAATPTTFEITVKQLTQATGESSNARTVNGSSNGAISLSDGSTFSISCLNPALYILNPPGARITFNNLCGYQATVENITDADLPGILPDDVSLLSGVNISVFDGGSSLDPLPNGATLLIDLAVQSGESDGQLTFLFWDGNAWTELSGQMTLSNFFELVSTRSGTFVLVSK